MVIGWLPDGEGGGVAEIEKSEKITINLGLVDLGQIDLLVDEGFYANRTDFIRTAIRRQLDSRAAAVNDTVERRALTLSAPSWRWRRSRRSRSSAPSGRRERSRPRSPLEPSERRTARTTCAVTVRHVSTIA